MDIHSDIPSKLELLLTLSKLQIDFSGAFVEANMAKSRNDFVAADSHFEKQYATGMELLTYSELHNQHHPDPVEIDSLIRTLSNGLSIHADLLQSNGQLSQAEAKRSIIRELTHKYLGKADHAELERSQASSLISQGRFNEALQSLALAADHFHLEGDELTRARVTLDMADLLNWLGDFERAQVSLKDAESAVEGRLQEETPQDTGVLSALMHDIGSIMEGNGNPGTAQNNMALYRIATELDYYQGLISRSLGDLDLAEQCFKKVLPEYQKLGVGAAIEYQMAAIALERGEPKRALHEIEKLEPLFENDIQLRPKLAALLRIKGDVLLALNQNKSATESFRRGINELNTYYDPDILWRVQAQYALSLQKNGQVEDALTTYTDAIHTIDNLRKSSLGFRLDNLYLKDKIEMFSRAILLSAEQNRAELCAEFIDMIKSRMLTAVLSANDLRSNDNPADSDFSDLSRTIDKLEFNGFRDGNANDLRQQREALLAKRAELIERKRIADPRWKVLSTPSRFSITTYQQALATDNLACISLYVDNESSVTAVLICQDQSQVKRCSLSDNVINKLQKFSKNLQQPKPDATINDISLSLAVGAKHLIPVELLDEALKYDGLIIIPHGQLHLIPWAGLIYNGKRLFEYQPVSILPNLSCITSFHKALAKSPKAGFIGPPDYNQYITLANLELAKQEVQQCAKIYRDNHKLVTEELIGNDANSNNYWDLSAQLDNGLLHISCHGVLEPFEPMNSGLLLANEKLDAAEIINRRTNVSEVILSACSSGWRPMEAQNVKLVGDDILGLPSAFLEAGAKSVLVSVPPAGDATTADFMTHYHSQRAIGKLPMTALQATQLYMLKNMIAPYKWVGFTLYGCQ